MAYWGPKCAQSFPYMEDDVRLLDAVECKCNIIYVRTLKLWGEFIKIGKLIIKFNITVILTFRTKTTIVWLINILFGFSHTIFISTLQVIQAFHVLYTNTLSYVAWMFDRAIVRKNIYNTISNEKELYNCQGLTRWHYYLYIPMISRELLYLLRLCYLYFVYCFPRLLANSDEGE